jgi:hypothetical protein
MIDRAPTQKPIAVDRDRIEALTSSDVCGVCVLKLYMVSGSCLSIQCESPEQRKEIAKWLMQ